jgi:hypothetical protein
MQAHYSTRIAPQSNNTRGALPDIRFGLRNKEAVAKQPADFPSVGASSHGQRAS